MNRLEFEPIRVLYNRVDDAAIREERRTIWGDLRPIAAGQDRAAAHRVPYTHALFILSKDGRSIDSLMGGVGRMSGVACDRFGQLELRATVDAFLIGAGTLREDRAIGTPMEPELVELRRRTRGDTSPLNVFFSAAGDVPEDARVFRDPAIPTLLFVTARATPRLAGLREIADDVVIVDSERPLSAVWAELARRGITTIGFEGGPRMMQMALRERLVHELLLTHSPLLLGGSGEGLASDDGPLRDVGSELLFLGLDERSGLLFERSRVLYSRGDR